MKKETDILIIGAGISGCAAAQELQSKGIDYTLLEKHVEPGGLTRSISVGDAHFDYTGHYLHLSKYTSPSTIPHAKQIDDDWQLVERSSVVFFNGKIIPAPLQYNLYAFPESLRNRCIQDFRMRPNIENPHTFKDYLLSGFGSKICDLFLFPYNEKQMAISLDKLSTRTANRFFPFPDEKLIEAGFEKQPRIRPIGYNDYFWYPKYKGIGLLSRGLAKDIKDLFTCCEVKEVNIQKRFAVTSQGKIQYKKIISSMPLKHFCIITKDSKLQSLSSLLSHNRVLCLNMLFDGCFNEYFDGRQWIYVPDKNIPFYRVGIYSHIPHSFVSPGKTAIYVEVSFNHLDSSPNLDAILDDVLSSLEKLGWVQRKDCVVITANWIDCAYVHFDSKREEALKQIFDILELHEIFQIGRYGLWDYISMEDSILSGIEVANKVAHS